MTYRTHRRTSRAQPRQNLTETPTSVPDARLLGWSPSAQRHAVVRGDIVALRRGVVAARGPSDDGSSRWVRQRDDHLLAARAASVASPRATISHVAAALAFDLPVLRVPPRPCLTVPAGTALRRIVAAHLHRAGLLPDDVLAVGVDIVTTPARTVMDLARELGVDAAVVTADAALHRGLTTQAELIDAFEQCRGWPGRKPARIALHSFDARTESPLESLSRLRIRSAGLPAPEPQVEIFDPAGRFLGRCDFYWDEFGVVGEADGDLKYGDDGASIAAERARQKYFERTGLVVVRWGMRDLRDFRATAQQLHEAFGRGARVGSPLRRWQARPTPLHPAASLTQPQSAS